MSFDHEFISRRRVLRGLLNGTVITVGLPFLDYFLDGNGTALADGAELPPCFGVWYRALGFTPGRWEPNKVGAGYEMAPDMAELAAYKDRINVFSGFRCMMDSNSSLPHFSGMQVSLQGTAKAAASQASIDQLVADVLGKRTRFRSIEVSCDGTATSYSRRNASTINPAEPSPSALYARIFGPDFKDPNAADFTPDPQVMVRKSVLSTISEQSHKFTQKLGASDRLRLDEYFTSLRELEKKLEIELQKPAPLAACTLPQKPEEAPTSLIMDDVRVNHELFAKLLAHALACGQTQVINVNFTGPMARKQGSGDNYHIHTHEEPTDPAVGYQPQVTWFQTEGVKAFRTMIQTLESIREGDRTLLDRTLLLHGTDVAFGRTHALDNFPVITAGGGTHIKTGLHIASSGDPVTRVGLTIQQALGGAAGEWGTESNRTSKTITEMML